MSSRKNTLSLGGSPESWLEIPSCHFSSCFLDLEPESACFVGQVPICPMYISVLQ